ncbi:MAG: anti-sigma factor [Steroidobacteraceae bacterium]
MNITDEVLMAYADGELDAAASTEIEAALAADPVLAARVQEHRALLKQLQCAFDAVLDEQLPERLVAAAKAPVQAKGTVVDLEEVRQKRAGTPTRHWSLPQWAAMAASLMIGLFIGHRTLQGNDPIVMRNGELVATGTLADALTAQLSSDEASEHRIGLTFRTKQGGYCRTFASAEKQPIAGVACRANDAWKVRAVSNTQTVTGDYRMAGSAMPAAVRAVVEDAIQGEPLTVAEEQAARSAGWK